MPPGPRLIPQSRVLFIIHQSVRPAQYSPIIGYAPRSPSLFHHRLEVQDPDRLNRDFPATFRAQTADACAFVSLQGGAQTSPPYDLGKLQFI